MDTPPIHDLYSVIEKDGVTAQVFGVYWNGKIDVRTRAGRDMILSLPQQRKWKKVSEAEPVRFRVTTHEITAA